MPALLRYLAPTGTTAPEDASGAIERAAGRGTVLFYHGVGGSKERVEPGLVELARAGFLAVGLDAVGHGERRLAGFDTVFADQRWDEHFEETETDFLRLIDATAAEIPSVIDDLVARGWARPDGIGVTGRSLGGNVAYASVLADRRVRAIVSVVGSPQWTLPWPDSPHHHPDGFCPVALQSQAAEHDEHCPPGPIREFHAKLEPFYAAEPDRTQYLEYLGAGHLLTPELNADSQARLVAWFERWISSVVRPTLAS